MGVEVCGIDTGLCGLKVGADGCGCWNWFEQSRPLGIVGKHLPKKKKIAGIS